MVCVDSLLEKKLAGSRWNLWKQHAESAVLSLKIQTLEAESAVLSLKNLKNHSKNSLGHTNLLLAMIFWFFRDNTELFLVFMVF